MHNFIKSIIFSLLLWTLPTIVAVMFNVYMSLHNGGELHSAVWTSIPWMTFFTIIVLLTIVFRYISYTRPATIFILPGILLVLILIPFLVFSSADEASAFLSFLYMFTMLPGLVTGFILSIIAAVVIFVMKRKKNVKNT